LELGCNVSLNWSPNPDGDILKYMIYHATASPDSGFYLLDSVFVPETTYVHVGISDTLSHGYAVTAIDSLGLEGPLQNKRPWVHAGTPPTPWGIEVRESNENSIVLDCQAHPTDLKNLLGCNFYRSPVSGEYEGLEPINDTLVPYDARGWATYTDYDVVEAVRSYYTPTNVSACNAESELSPMSPWLQDSGVPGVPESPMLKARSGRENIRLYISTSSTDIKAYKLFRREDQGTFKLVDPLYPDTIYTDIDVLPGVDYYYRVAAIDTFDLESEASSEVEGCLMLFDQGMLLVDMTRGVDMMDGVKGDSVDAFYQRALGGYDYSFARYDDWSSPLKLLELSSHPIAIVHCLDEPLAYRPLSGVAYDVLEQYLGAGGALLIDGRRNLPKEGWDHQNPEFLHFVPGDVGLDYFGVDSAHIPLDWLSTGETQEFIGAERTPHMDRYPQAVELDTFRVNHAYDPYGYAPEGKIPGVGHFWPSDTSEIIYTFVSAYDSSNSSGQAVALKHLSQGFALICFDFPLYFVKEEIATQILHQAISDLEEFAERPKGPAVATWDLSEASVFPNPFKSYQGHTHLTFDGLTAHAKIEIFTIAGERVCTLDETDGDGMTSWDVTNSRGRKLASGVYIYRVTDNQGHEKISRFAVIR
jgi:fibronectin type 3 domain-containing protein